MIVHAGDLAGTGEVPAGYTAVDGRAAFEGVSV